MSTNKAIRSVIIGQPLANLSALQTLDTTDYNNYVTTQVVGVGNFCLDRNSLLTADNLRVVNAAGVGGGRWINISPYNITPQLTTTQRNSLTKEAGLTVDDIDTGKRYRCDGSNWLEVLDSTSTGMVSLTDASSIAVDAALGKNFTVTLGGNRTLANPTNLVSGTTYRFVVRQDSTGNRTLAYGTAYKFPYGNPTVLSTAANAVNLFEAFYDGITLFMNPVGQAYA